MKRVLVRHESYRNKVSATNGQSGKHSSSSNGNFENHANGSRKAAPPFQHLNSFSSAAAGPSQNGATRTNLANSIGAQDDFEQPPDAETGRPWKEQISKTTLAATTESDRYNAPHRRSQRQKLHEIYHDRGAELLLSLQSIRKKLNFNSNHTQRNDESDIESSRPRKRAKRAAVECQCHVTIWENKGDAITKPLVVESEKCYLTTLEGASGTPPVVNIEMPQPIGIRSSRLEVDTTMPGKPPSSGIAEKYFLEIKIMPTHTTDIESGEAWPPIPILSRSEGELFSSAAQGKLPTEALHGALLAKYVHLPHAPEETVPLSVFFLRGGRCYKTKFGLQVGGEWMRPGVAAKEMAKIKREPDLTPEKLDPVFVDNSGRLFGRKLSDTSSSTKEVFRRSSRHSLRGPKAEGLKAEVNYVFDPKNKETSRQSRTAKLKGFCCPACRIGEFDELKQLQFHLINSHHKYRFDLESEDKDAETGELKKVVFGVTANLESGRGRLKEREIKDLRSEWEWNWEQPQEVFDIDAYVKGDRSWVGVASKEKKKPIAALALSNDPITAMRQKNGGFLPVSEVKEFLDNTQRRKRYTVVPTRTKETLPVYGSTGHIRLEDGDELSESDDEDLVEGHWLREKHLAGLREMEGQKGMSRDSVEFMLRWDGFRMAEGLGHPKFLADTVVRFARKEKLWLRAEGLQHFTKFLARLKARRVVDERVVAGLWGIVFGKQEDCQPKATGTNETEDAEMTEVDSMASNQVGVSRGVTQINGLSHHPEVAQSPGQLAEELLALPLGTCGECRKQFRSLVKEAIRCGNYECKAPAVLYHMACVSVARRNDRWHCGVCCKQRKLEKGKEKAKEVARPIMNGVAETDRSMREASSVVPKAPTLNGTIRGPGKGKETLREVVHDLDFDLDLPFASRHQKIPVSEPPPGQSPAQESRKVINGVRPEAKEKGTDVRDTSSWSSFLEKQKHSHQSTTPKAKSNEKLPEGPSGRFENEVIWLSD